MFRWVFLTAVILGSCCTALQAKEQLKIATGVETNLPFTLLIGGESNRDRNNIGLGINVRNWFTESANYGLRFQVDAEKQTGSIRQWGLAPGFAYHWMPQESWRPFIRFDLPVVLAGAANSRGQDDLKDLGVSAGVGFVWKLGDAIGLENMEFRYDFDVNYFIGIGDPLSVLALDLFRAGFDYRF